MEMEMEENPWKPLFWERVAVVHRVVPVMREVLAAAQQQLTSPTGTARTASELKGAEEKLVRASRTLGFTMSFIDAAHLLALHRGGLNQQGLVPCYGRVHDDDLLVRRALFNLQVAKSRAEEAYDALDKCQGHLGAALRLLIHEDVLDIGDHIDDELVSAAGDLEAARQLVVDVDAFISVALGNPPVDGSDVA